MLAGTKVRGVAIRGMELNVPTKQNRRKGCVSCREKAIMSKMVLKTIMHSTPTKGRDGE